MDLGLGTLVAAKSPFGSKHKVLSVPVPLASHPSSHPPYLPPLSPKPEAPHCDAFWDKFDRDNQSPTAALFQPATASFPSPIVPSASSTPVPAFPWELFGFAVLARPDNLFHLVLLVDCARWIATPAAIRLRLHHIDPTLPYPSPSYCALPAGRISGTGKLSTPKRHPRSITKPPLAYPPDYLLAILARGQVPPARRSPSKEQSLQARPSQWSWALQNFPLHKISLI